MKPLTTDTTPSPAPADSGRRKTLEELIAEQGIVQTATFEHLLGAGSELWDDDRDFGRFLDAVQAARHEKG
jgi:hypothetical protein